MRLFKTFIPLTQSGLSEWGIDGVAGEVLADNRADALHDLLDHGMECDGFDRKDLNFRKATSSQSKEDLSGYSHDDACHWCQRLADRLIFN